MRVLCGLYAQDDLALNYGKARLGVQAIEQVIYDFLAHITSRPDRKVNKVLCMWPCVFQSTQDACACLERRLLTLISLSRQALMTTVEAELQQARMTISTLKDTQMRQETILRQYAEEVCIRGYRVLFFGCLPDDRRLHSARINAGRARAVFLKLTNFVCFSPDSYIWGCALAVLTGQIPKGCHDTSRCKSEHAALRVSEGDPSSQKSNYTPRKCQLPAW
jgi:hypothetical protein